jgi:hypothetical protein
MLMDAREEDAEAAAELGWRPNSVGPFQYLTQSQVLQERLWLEAILKSPGLPTNAQAELLQ